MGFSNRVAGKAGAEQWDERASFARVERLRIRINQTGTALVEHCCRESISRPGRHNMTENQPDFSGPFKGALTKLSSTIDDVWSDHGTSFVKAGDDKVYALGG